VLLAGVFLGGSGDIILDTQALTGAVGMAGLYKLHVGYQ
jgi:hypothetical protein